MRILIALFLFLTSHVFAQEYLVDEKFDIRPSWDRAHVYLPGKLLSTNTQDITSAGERDAVIFLHGCTGIKNDEIGWAKFLTDLGYVVVLPDSLAIKGRPVNCSPSSFTTTAGAIDPRVLFKIRVFEFRQAQQNLRRFANIRKIYLMGFSEGAATVNFYGGKDLFDGVISISSHCRGPVNVRKEVPVLTIDFASDPWFRNDNSCALQYKEHHHYTNVTLDGSGHEAVRNKKAEDAVRVFLSSHRENTSEKSR